MSAFKGSQRQSGLLLLQRHGRVTEIVLNRVDALNAISTQLAEELTLATAEVAADSGVSVALLSSGTDRAFCVGADLKERASFSDEDLMRQRPIFRAAFAGVRDLPVPVVSAVSGFALGGGYELALSGDLIVADDTAVVGLPETTVGLVPGCGGTQLVARRAGVAAASDLLFTGRKVAAQEALALHLVDRLAPAPARDEALRLACAIAENSPVALRQAKQALRLGADAELRAALDLEHEAWRTTALSADRREGIAAFAQKRAPIWPG